MFFLAHPLTTKKNVQMKLLIDQNISHKIIDSISDIYPESIHVTELNLAEDTDLQIWEYALVNDFVFLTTDSETCNRNVISTNSPKIICIKSEVVTTTKVEWTLRVNQETIEQFINSNDISSCLLIKV